MSIRLRTALPMILLPLIGGCLSSETPAAAYSAASADPKLHEAYALLMGPAGERRGRVAFDVTGNDLKLTILLQGLPDGVYVADLNRRGQCDTTGDMVTDRGGALVRVDAQSWLREVPSPAVSVIGGVGASTLTIGAASLNGDRRQIFDQDGATVRIYLSRSDMTAGSSVKWVACGAVLPGRRSS